MRATKVNEPEGFLVFVALCIFISLVLYAAIAGTKGHEKRVARRAEYVTQNGCVVVGFYGRDGEYKVYNCGGRILRENEL